jgi:hypothetical protein
MIQEGLFEDAIFGEEPYDGYNQTIKDSYKKKRFEINRFTTELLNKKILLKLKSC